MRWARWWNLWFLLQTHEGTTTVTSDQIVYQQRLCCRSDGRFSLCTVWRVDRQEVLRFERTLDEELSRRPIMHAESAEALTLCMLLLASAHRIMLQSGSAHAVADMLDRGLQVALPALVRPRSGPDLAVADALDDLEFLSHYNSLRELLYIAYNAPELLEWQAADSEVRISYATPTIARLYSRTGNSAILNSKLIAAEVGNDRDGFLTAALTGAEEFGEVDEKVVDELIRRAEIRFKHEFNLVPPDTVLPHYRYADFLAVHRYLVVKLSYHRWYAISNDELAVFQFPKDDLVREISANAEVSESIVRLVLADLTLSPSTAHLPSTLFHVFDNPNLGNYLISPWLYLGAEGFVCHLRGIALANNSWFSSHLAGPIGDGFVHRAAEHFREAGFLVATNVTLDHVSAGAPDIDLLVVSHEPTLGYAVWICEAKGTLPPLWAKDHLRHRGPSVVPKAQRQLTRILDVLREREGARFLQTKLAEMVPGGQRDDMIVALFALVITSQSDGLLAEQTAQVVDLPTLAHILRSCDGDVLYVNAALRNLEQSFGIDDEVTEITCQIGEMHVSYPAVARRRIVAFAENRWRAAGLEQKYIDEYFRALDHESSLEADTSDGT